MKPIIPIFALATSMATLSAQDTRQITEPRIPPSCVVLKADLHATDNALAAADETRLDTQRIQAALDHCGAGHAVELSIDGSNNAFLGGPLELRKGVTLLIDKGVTLYASRNPRTSTLPRVPAASVALKAGPASP